MYLRRIHRIQLLNHNAILRSQSFCKANLSTQTTKAIASGDSTSFRKSIKSQRANLLKFLELENIDSVDDFGLLLKDAASVKNHSLTVALIQKLTTSGNAIPLTHHSMMIQSLEACGEVDEALKLYNSLPLQDAVQVILTLKPTQLSSGLAEAALDTFRKVVAIFPDIGKEGILGNNTLCVFESLSTVSEEQLKEALDLKQGLQESGALVQRNTFASLIGTANKARNFEVAMQLFGEFKAAQPEDSPSALAVETQHLNTLLLKGDYVEVVKRYSELEKDGLEAGELMVCHVVDACVRTGRFETAIKVINKWHDGGGITTWAVSRAILDLSTAIDNYVYKTDLPLAPLTSVHFKDTVCGNDWLRGKNYLVRNGVSEMIMPSRFEKPETSPETVAASVSSSAQEVFDHQAESEALLVNSADESAAQALEDLSVSQGVVAEEVQQVPQETSSEKSKSLKAAKPSVKLVKVQFKDRQSRLEFFNRYLVKRVVNRVNQSLDMGLRRHRKESTPAEHIVSLVSGHMALAGRIDFFLEKLQQDDKDGELSPLVRSVFVSAPIQILHHHPGHWRELVSLVERMRHYGDQLPAEVHVAAMARCAVVLHNCNEKRRAAKYLGATLDLMGSDKALEPLVLGILTEVHSSATVLHIVDQLTQRKVAITPELFSVALFASTTAEKIINTCKVWASNGESAESHRPLSETQCAEIAMMYRRSAWKGGVQEAAVKEFLTTLGSTVSLSDAQKELLVAEINKQKVTDGTAIAEPVVAAE